MHLMTHIRQKALLASVIATIAALAAVASASPALAEESKTAYGSGAAVQKSIQKEIWIPESGQAVTYTATNSAAGFNEFGNFTGKLDTTQDPGAPKGQLDGYVAVDSAPIGPETKEGTELNKAAIAAYGEPVKAGTGEVTIPVGQVVLALLISLPTKITLNSKQTISLRNLIAAELHAGTLPEKGGYPGNTWGAALTTDGLEAIKTGSPKEGQFLDTGNATEKNGGFAPIKVEVRSNGAGATLVLKQYLNAVDSTDWPSSFINENTEGTGGWPSGATTTPVGGNSSDSNEASNTAGTSGTTGYSTLASAVASKFAATPTTVETETKQHQILYALLQDNGTGSTEVQYANPAGESKQGNAYTGSKIKVGAGESGVGEWIVPNTAGVVTPTGPWATSATVSSEYTHAWDPNVYKDAGAGNTTKYYPLVIALFDLGWSSYTTGKLGEKELFPKGVVNTIKSYFNYVTKTNVEGSTEATSGQFAEQNDSSYYNELPTGASGIGNIQADAEVAAGGL